MVRFKNDVVLSRKLNIALSTSLKQTWQRPSRHHLPDLLECVDEDEYCGDKANLSCQRKIDFVAIH